MKFYTLDDVPKYGDDKVFKSSTFGKAVATVIMFGISIACLAAAIIEPVLEGRGKMCRGEACKKVRA